MLFYRWPFGTTLIIIVSLADFPTYDAIYICKILSRPLPPIRIMHTYPVLISAATMSNMTVLDTADPYDLDMTSSEAIYPISFQVLCCVVQPQIAF